MNRALTSALALVLVLPTAQLAAGCRSAGSAPIRRRVDAGTMRDVGEDAQPGCTLAPSDDSFCRSYAQALCAAQLACCDDPTRVPASAAACEAEVREACAGFRQDGCVGSGAIVTDRAMEEAILARLRTAALDCTALPPTQIDHALAIRGTLVEGDDCSPVGTDWSPIYACADGLYCHFEDVTSEEDVAVGSCRLHAAMGAACSPTRECGPGARCVAASLDDESGTCVAAARLGEACLDDLDCESERCDGATSLCVAADPTDTWCGQGEGSE